MWILLGREWSGDREVGKHGEGVKRCDKCDKCDNLVTTMSGRMGAGCGTGCHPD